MSGPATSGAAAAAAERTAGALWIVNPVAGYGRGGDYEGRVRDAVPGAAVHRTTAPGDALAAARAAVRDGRRVVVAVGGDGTLSEVVNGVLEADPAGDVAVGFVPAGTCSDFSRGREVAARLADVLDPGRARRIDVGRVVCAGADGPVERAFVVNCTVGLVSAIGERFVQKQPLNLALKRVSVKAAEAVYGLDTLLRWRAPRMTVRLDGDEWHAPATNLAVLKVPWFAGGLSFGSAVRDDDGRLEAVLVEGAGRLATGRLLVRAFRNRLAGSPELRMRATTRVEVETDRPLPVEVDGEIVGRTPATFTVEPARLLTIT